MNLLRYKFLFLILTCLAACNQDVRGKHGDVYKSATEYNDYIVGRQTIVMKDVMEFVDVSKHDLDSAELILEKTIGKIDRMIIEIRQMPAYKGDSVLRDAAVATFGFYKKIFGDEYKQLISMRRSGRAESADGIAEMNRIVAQITRNEEQYDKAFHDAQRDFAKRNNMRLKENEMQDDINKLND